MSEGGCTRGVDVSEEWAPRRRGSTGGVDVSEAWVCRRGGRVGGVGVSEDWHTGGMDVPEEGPSVSLGSYTPLLGGPVCWTYIGVYLSSGSRGCSPDGS